MHTVDRLISLAYDKTTPQASTNLQRRIYNTRLSYGAEAS